MSINYFYLSGYRIHATNFIDKTLLIPLFNPYFKYFSFDNHYKTYLNFLIFYQLFKY